MEQSNRFRSRDDSWKARLLQYLRHRRCFQIIALSEHVTTANGIQAFRAVGAQPVKVRTILDIAITPLWSGCIPVARAVPLTSVDVM